MNLMDKIVAVMVAGVPSDKYLAHVRHVKDADTFSYCLMLSNDSIVLYRHFPTSKISHLGPELQMVLEQWCLVVTH